MRLFVGTSGYAYKEWKGTFYPDDLPSKEMLPYYASRFSTVEMNNTFYQMPTKAAIQSWARQVPSSFRFAIKAPQTITHRKRLRDVKAELRQLFSATSALKERHGPFLFQLPPNFKKDLPRLKTFLKLVVGRAPSAFEFRHGSWFDEEVYECLRRHSCALCIADTDETSASEIVSTADWGYVRLRREKYTRKAIAEWANRIGGQKWKEAYVYFRHEETGTGPKFAKQFLELAEAAA